MGVMVGGAESLIAGAAGLMAVNEVVKATPALAYAANGAMNQFTKGVREAGRSAIGEGVPGIRALGGTLRDLGTEVGSVGAEHMPAALSAVSSLAGTATKALHDLDPAIDSGITGLAGLGQAVARGISSPTSVSQIRATGQALSDPGNIAGLTNLVSGVSNVAGTVARVGVDVAGGVGNVLGIGGEQAQGPLTAAAISAYLFGKGGKGLKGKIGRGGVAAGVAFDAEAVAENMQRGGLSGTPGTLGGMIGGAIGSVGGPIGAGVGFAVGQAVGTVGEAFHDDPHRAWRGALGLSDDRPKAAASNLSPAEQQSVSRHGWTRDAGGTLAPGTAASDRVQRHQQAVDRANNATETRQAGRLMTGGAIQRPPPNLVGMGPGSAVHQFPSALQQIQQRNQALAPSFQQVGQNAVQTSQQVQRLGSTVAPTVQSLNTMPRQVDNSLQQAHHTMVQGGNAMGSQLGPSAAQGIKGGTSKACDASADLGAAAVKCAASALGVKSPSAAFAYLGSMTGPGLAQGAVASIGAASGAVGGAVTALTGAAAAGLTTTMTAQINANGLSGFAQTGLKLGYVLGENAVSGAQQVIQKNVLTALTTPTGLSQQAMTGLAGTGLGSPAGSGASSWNMPQGMVAFAGAGSAANPAPAAAQTITIEPQHIYLDGHHVATIAETVLMGALGGLAERIPRQRG
jgi:hypothetical protein